MFLFYTFAHAVAVGIDLGTINSCVKVYDEKGKVISEVLVDSTATFPSAVAYESAQVKGEWKHLAVVGAKAFTINETYPNKNNIFIAVKRLIGLTDEDFKPVEARLSEIAAKSKKTLYELEKDANGVYLVHKDLENKFRRRVGPTDISSEILAKAINAVKEIHDVISKVVITVPAYFTENQVKATQAAALIAGITPDRLLNEPVAAAYTYQIMNPGSRTDCYLVFDMGGGTLDISVLEYGDQVLEVKTYSGDNFLGGEDVNNALEARFIEILKKNNFVPKTDNEMIRLRNFVEAFKIDMCNEINADKLKGAKTDTPKIHSKDFWISGEEKVNIGLTEDEFNTICSEVFKRVLFHLNDKKHGIVSKYESIGGKKESITKVLFVGGSTRIPKIREIVGSIFGNHKLNYSLDADTCVAEGAAYYAAFLGGFLNENDSLHLVDVVPMSIGICVNEDTFETILAMDQSIPAKGSKIFTTAYDNQNKVSIQVAQGLRYSFKDNSKLGTFDLVIKNPGPRGGPQIEVTIQMDQNRNVEVIAIDKATNEESKITFTRFDVSLSDEQVRNLKKNKEDNAKQDEELKARYEKRTEFEHEINKIETELKTVNEPNKKEALSKLVTGARAWLNVHMSTFDINELQEVKDKFMKDVEEVKGEKSMDGERVMEDKAREEL